MRRKLRLEMLDDYVAVFRIIYLCRSSIFVQTENQTECEVIKVIEQDAISLQKKYDKTFERIGMLGPSFLLFRRELSNETDEKKFSESKKQISKEKLDNLQNKLKLLESKHNAITLKLHYK